MNKFYFLFVLIFLSSLTLSWSCATHQYICDEAGFIGDCCYADTNRTPSPLYHHCVNNFENCSARVKAAEYFESAPQISAHLWADSLCPAHWFSLTGSCHSSFESKVNDYIKANASNWSVTEYCIDTNGVNQTLQANETYMKEVVKYVQEKMGIVMPSPSPTPTPSPNPSWEIPQQGGSGSILDGIGSFVNGIASFFSGIWKGIATFFGI